MRKQQPEKTQHRPGFKQSPDECPHVVIDEWVVAERVIASRCCDCGEEGV